MMIQEEKQLLLKDLCARQPYGVKVEIDGYGTHILKCIDGDTISTDRGINYPLRLVKPYLRQMPDIQDPLLNELDDLIANKKFYEITTISQDWYNKHHFDYRGLIEKGLALEAPEGMYETKTE